MTDLDTVKCRECGHPWADHYATYGHTVYGCAWVGCGCDGFAPPFEDEVSE